MFWLRSMYPGAQPRCEDTAQPKQGLAEERELFLIAYITQRRKTAYIYIIYELLLFETCIYHNKNIVNILYMI